MTGALRIQGLIFSIVAVLLIPLAIVMHRHDSRIELIMSIRERACTGHRRPPVSSNTITIHCFRPNPTESRIRRRALLPILSKRTLATCPILVLTKGPLA